MNKLFLSELGIKKLLDFYPSNKYVLNERRTLEGMFTIVFNEINNNLKELVIDKVDDNRVDINLTDDTGRVVQRDKYILRNNEFVKVNGDEIIRDVNYKSTVDKDLEHFNVNTKSTMKDINNKLLKLRIHDRSYISQSNEAKETDIVK